MIYLLSIKNFKALVPLQLGVTNKQTNWFAVYLGKLDYRNIIIAIKQAYQSFYLYIVVKNSRK